MIISALTTAIAIAAVLGVIGYRVFRAGESDGGTIAGRAGGIVMLPKGAHLVSTSVSNGRIVVTLDIAGTSEIRIFDLNTLQQTGRLRFATEP
jgi:hypothetical protein